MPDNVVLHNTQKRASFPFLPMISWSCSVLWRGNFPPIQSVHLSVNSTTSSVLGNEALCPPFFLDLQRCDILCFSWDDIVQTGQPVTLSARRNAVQLWEPLLPPALEWWKVWKGLVVSLAPFVVAVFVFVATVSMTAPWTEGLFRLPSRLPACHNGGGVLSPRNSPHSKEFCRVWSPQTADQPPCRSCSGVRPVSHKACCALSLLIVLTNIKPKPL